MAEIVCTRCGLPVQDLDTSRKNALTCPACGERPLPAHEGIHKRHGSPATDPRQVLSDQERIKANLDEASRPVRVRCPECGSRYEWETPLVVASVNRAPSCENCAAPYPMACQDCGLDLTVDGFQVKLLKDEGNDSDREQTWGLFCPECGNSYDRFAIPRFELKPCAQCGKSVAAGGLHLRQVNEKVGVGARAWHRAIMVGVCSECAKGIDAGPKSFVYSMAILVAVLALFGLLCWLMG